MEFSSIAVILTLLTLCLGLSEFVDATADSNTEVLESLISCYDCHSDRDGDVCHDPVIEGEMEKIECKNGHNACLKVVTYGDSPGTLRNPTTDFRITTRMCATHDGKGGCKYLEGTGTDTYKCYCKGDLCNSGHVITASLVTWSYCGILLLIRKLML